jgi:4-hydroxy-3-polyprenylbenzoate decarboxylase
MPSRPESRRLALAMTGASGAVYGLRVLEELQRAEGTEIHLTISPSAAKVLRVEHDIEVDLDHFEPAMLNLLQGGRITYHHHADVAAPLASGSFRVEAMAIVPCSMGCAGRIAHGISGDLVERAADVMIKERRRLIAVPRETPLSAVHLENLLALSRLGVTVLPASPGFYGRPRSVSEMVDFIVARVLDHLGVEHGLGPRWGEGKAK